MAPKKATAGERASKFLAQIGTAGGPIGAPSLIGFGASDLMQQVQSGNVDQYAAIRANVGAPAVGSPNAPQPAMPQDLDAGYLKLNLPGSPLPRNGLMMPQLLDSAQYTQDQIAAEEQYNMYQFLQWKGQLPMGIQPPATQKKGSR